jgi:hypothetical protein
MKVKMKFDLASIKTWLFEHGEKLAFGTMVLVFLMFAYSALQREVLDPTKGETKLAETARAVTEHVSKSTWDVKNAGVQIVDYRARAKRDPVPPEAFAANRPLAPPIFDPKGKRDDPELFSVEEPRAGAGVGIFALKATTAPAAASAAPGARPGVPGGGSKPGVGGGVRPTHEAKLKSQAWAVVTALVPVEKQAAEYNRVFANAMGQAVERDTPYYSRPIVERAEIDPKNPDKLDWKPLGPLTVSQADWETGGDEIVDLKYLDPNLTFRLGPLVGVGWNESVAHPKILPNWVTSAAEAAAPAVSAAPTAAVAPPAKPAAAARTISHKLLRVFDYSVQPNGRYRYRVKLELKNPNFGVNAKFLKNPAAPLNNQEFRTSEKWSDPTEVVAIPSGYEVLAGGVEAKSYEPAANLLVTALNRDDGIPASTKTKTYRASLANKKESKVLATHPATNKVIELDDVDFNSGFVVVDIYGGKNVSLPKRRESPFAAPGEVLLLDAHGNLTVHNDLEDHDQFLTREPPEEAEVTRAEPEKTDDKAKKAPRVGSKSGR